MAKIEMGRKTLLIINLMIGVSSPLDNVRFINFTAILFRLCLGSVVLFGLSRFTAYTFVESHHNDDDKFSEDSTWDSFIAQLIAEHVNNGSKLLEWFYWVQLVRMEVIRMLFCTKLRSSIKWRSPIQDVREIASSYRFIVSHTFDTSERIS